MDGLTAEEAQMFHYFDKVCPLFEMADELLSEKNETLFCHDRMDTLSDVINNHPVKEDVLVDVGAKTKYYGKDDIDQFKKESLDTEIPSVDRIDSGILKLEKHQLSKLENSGAQKEDVVQRLAKDTVVSSIVHRSSDNVHISRTDKRVNICRHKPGKFSDVGSH